MERVAKSLGGLWEWMTSKFRLSPPPIDSHPSVQAANQRAIDFEPDPDVDYRRVLEFAKERYGEVQHAFDRLDEKADRLFQTGGGLAGLMGIVGIQIKDLHGIFAWGSLICFLMAMIYAMRVSMPQESRVPGRTSDVLEQLRHRGDDRLTGDLILRYEAAATAMNVIANWKADALSVVSTLIWSGVVLAIVSVLTS